MKRSWIRKLVFAFITLIVVLGSTELLLRLLTRSWGQASIPSESVLAHVRDGTMKYHEELGWVRAELPQPRNGINAEGFRYADLPKEKAPGTWRAFALGDSQTYGAGVQAQETWPARAESQLRELHPDAKIELVNAGISGYSSLQALRLIRSKLLQWSPDLVIIDCRTYDSPRDLYVPRPSGLTAPLERAFFHFRTYYVLRLLVDRSTGAWGRRMTPTSQERSAPQIGERYGSHGDLLALGRERGFEVIFLDYPFWDNRRDLITPLAHAHEMPKGARIVSTVDALTATQKKASELFLDNNHLSVEGNRVVGGVVAEFISRGGLMGAQGPR